MKAQDFKNSAGKEGQSTADRAFTDNKEAQKQRGVSNSGGQASFETSNKDSAHQPQKKKD